MTSKTKRRTPIAVAVAIVLGLAVPASASALNVYAAASLREVFEQTRTTMADRTLVQLAQLDVDVTPTIDLAVRGWIAFVEEATITWLRNPQITRDELIDLNVNALPAVALAPGMISALLGADADA